MSNNLVTMSTTEEESTAAQHSSTAPEKYPVRSGTINHGNKYEIYNISLLALNCCFEESEDFWMASNADGCGALDDIVMFRKRKEEDQGVTYFLQLKHQDEAKPIVTKTFLNETSEYSFVKYSECYSRLQKKIETETNNTILTHLKQNPNMVFIIFTNRRVSIKKEYTKNSGTDRPATDRVATNSATQSNLPQTDLTNESAAKILLQIIQLQTNLLEIIKSSADLSTDVSVSVTDKLQKISQLQTNINQIGHTGKFDTHGLLQISQLQTSLLHTILLRLSLINKSVTDRTAIVPEFLIKINKNSPREDIGCDADVLKNIGCDGDVFKIDYKVLEDEPKINVEFLKQLYLFTNQLRCSSMKKKLKSTLIEKLGHLKLSNDDISNIVSEFAIYIDEWANLRRGHNYPLTKQIILKKLVELLLFRYKFPVQTEENDKRMGKNDIKENEVDIWYEITKCKDVMVIDDADDVVRRYVRNVTNRIICNEGILNSSTKININLPEFERYERLWKTGTIPLILEVSDKGGVQYIGEVLKHFPKVLRIIILNKTKFPLEGFEDLNLSVNFNDLRTEHQEYILKKRIKFQGRDGSCIHELNINSELLKFQDIVEILCGKFYMGRKFDDLPKFFVEMALTTNIFDIKLLQSSKDIFVVKCGMDDFESVLQNQLGSDAKRIIHWERLNKADFNSQIIVFDDIKNLEEIEKFCLTLTKAVHFLLWHGGDHADLIKSINIKEDQKKPNQTRTSTKPILITDLLRIFYEKKQTLIISAIPGMGKSVLMNYFALNMPVHLWVLDIPLAKYQDHYKNWEGQNCDSQQSNFELFWKEVIKAQQTPNTDIFNSAFKQFLEYKNVVFLLDGLDEVSLDRKNGAMQLIKFINQSGHYTCVTTRPFLQEQLQFTLYTSAITLKMFTKDEQTFYLRKYFADVGELTASNEKVRKFVYELLKATKTNLNDFDQQFTGVPLQTKLLAEVFENDFRKYLDDEIFRNEHFDLIYLYEHFINKKIEIACTEKAKSVSVDEIHCFKKCRSLYGLRHIFDKQDLQELKIDEELNIINKNLPHALQQIQKDGITVIHGDSNVTFVHQTYAEYLAANWLAENRIEQKEVVGKLYIKCFASNFVVVRNMFDRILAKNCPLHTAIINRQIDTIEKLILDENVFDVIDHGGRTIAHLMSTPNPGPGVYNDVANLIEDKIRKSNKMLKDKLGHVKDELLHYTVLDYAILNRCLYIAYRLVWIIPNASYNINITKIETDSILQDVKIYRSVSLYIIVLKCFLRTSCNEHEVKEIHKKIRHGDLYRIQSLISEQNVDDPDSEGRTLLHAATKGGHKDTVQFLLKNNANVNKTDDNGRSALHWASYLGHMDIISMLLDHGAEPNATDCYDLTTYHYAILSSLENQVGVVSLLLSRNTTIVTQEFNAIDKIRHLSNRYEVHPVYLANLVTQEAILNLILSHNIDANIKGFRGITALMFAAENNDIDSINLLLDNNADVHAVDDKNQTALHYAASCGNGKAITVLLANNADANARDSENRTPLHFAAKSNINDAVTILLANNADANARDSENRTPLHFAAKSNINDAVTILLANNADANARDSDNETPLHWAARSFNKDALTILLTHGVDVNARNSYNGTPLDIAVRKGYQDIVTILNNANQI